MDRKITITNILIYFFELTGSLLMLCIIWHYYHDWKLVAAFLILFLLYQLGNYFILLYNRKKADRFVKHLAYDIDEMQNGNYEITYKDQTETIESFLEHKLQQLYESIKSQKEKTKAEKENLQEVISHISHQIKTPLTNISIVGETLNKGVSNSDEYLSLTDILNQQIKKLDFLIQSFVRMSLLETNIIQLKPESGHMSDTISKALTSIMLAAENKNIALYVECPDFITGYYDLKWSEEVFFNLLDNAVKYTDEHGKIEIIAEALTDYTKVQIKDNGKGIPVKNQSLIFKRFYREAEVHNTEGTGLGLYLSQKIMHMQGGSITVESAPKKGSNFILYFRKNGNDDN